MVRPLQNTRIVYRSCRDRPCPKCQGSGTRTLDPAAPRRTAAGGVLPRGLHRAGTDCRDRFLQQSGRLSDPVPHSRGNPPHHCPRPPAPGRRDWFLRRAAHLGAELASASHLHCVVPGGGLSPDGEWKACLPGFFLPVRVRSRLFRRLFLEALEKAYADGQLQFFSDLEPLRDPSAFAQFLAPVRQTEWVVYAKPPFGGPPQVIEYLGRYTHRVAISNQRLVALPDGQVSFRWKDYRHPEQPKVTTVSAEEFIRRFLLHALPPGFQRIRYFGLLANCHRAGKLQLCRQQLAPPTADLLPMPKDYRDFYAALTAKNLRLCPECGIGTMIRIEILPPCHRSEEHTSELQSLRHLVCRLLLEK